jgi:hypothetical protein
MIATAVAVPCWSGPRRSSSGWRMERRGARQQHERALPANRLRGPESTQRGGRSPAAQARRLQDASAHGCRPERPPSPRFAHASSGIKQTR